MDFYEPVGATLCGRPSSRYGKILQSQNSFLREATQGLPYGFSLIPTLNNN